MASRKDGTEHGNGPQGFSRRELLKRAGIFGIAAALPVSVVPSATASGQTQEPFETLTAAESDTLEAIVARLIPSDENGPGATEARAAHYIDRALTGPLASSRAAYLVVPVKQTVTYRASFGHVVLFQEYRKRLRSK